MGGEAFKEFWGAYPKREGANPKAPAEQKFANAVKAGADPKEIVAAAGRYAEEIRRGGKEAKFVAQAVTWLNQKRWEDYSAGTANGSSDIPVDIPPELHEDYRNGWRPGLRTSKQIKAEQKEEEDAKSKVEERPAAPKQSNGAEILRDGGEALGSSGIAALRLIANARLRSF